MRTFLLQTSILSRLSGPLCDAVTGQDGGKATLEALDRGNLFLVPLDDRRRWYRYHQLFADVLRAHLEDEQPDRVLELHRRASAWHDQNGDRPEAIRHAMAGEDIERAADLIELALPAMRMGRGEATVLGWLRALPDELVGRRPVLGAAYAWVLIASGELEGVERRLQEAERSLTATDRVPGGSGTVPPGTAVANRNELLLVPAMIALYRAVLAQIRGDVPATVRYARTVLDLAPEDDDLLHGGAAALLGLASWASGDLEAAYLIHSEGMARVQRAGNIPDAMNASIALADIRITQGRLGEAIQTYDQAFQLSAKHGEPVLPGTADLHVGLADIVREQGDLASATQHLQASTDLGEHMGFPQARHRRHVVTARILEAEGDLDGALDALNEAQRVYVPDFSPDVHPLAARKARVWVRQGRVAEAGAWARERSLSAEDDLSYLREFEHITLARTLLARSRQDRAAGSAREALDLLGRLLRAAEEGQRTGSVIEILVLQALAHQIAGDVPAALVPLERALTLAEPEGYVRMFADEGPPMAALLEAAAKHGVARTYVRRLQAAFGRPEGRVRVNQDLVEPLSERELDVLRSARDRPVRARTSPASSWCP